MTRSVPANSSVTSISPLVGQAPIDLLGHAEAKAIKRFDLDHDQRSRLLIRERL
jgi:hypothetical protein